MKRCPRCGISKPHSAFNKDRAKSDGCRSTCRECDNAVKRSQYRPKGPDDSWASSIRRYGLRPEQWQAMFDEQHGLCYLGAHPLPEDRFKIHVDHDHSHCGPKRACGACRRGLACDACNLVVGFAHEDPQRLRIIADRLEQQQAVTRALILAAPSQLAMEVA